jgi:shikimate 5-dehydrogenase
MHESAARAIGIELRYERFEVTPDDLAEAVRR